VDTDNSGYIEYNEFITSTVEKNTMLTKQNLEQAFNAFDKDKSGSISVSEVK
jgi:calcium-dependent protein kinase